MNLNFRYLARASMCFVSLFFLAAVHASACDVYAPSSIKGQIERYSRAMIAGDYVSAIKNFWLDTTNYTSDDELEINELASMFARKNSWRGKVESVYCLGYFFDKDAKTGTLVAQIGWSDSYQFVAFEVGLHNGIPALYSANFDRYEEDDFGHFLLTKKRIASENILVSSTQFATALTESRSPGFVTKLFGYGGRALSSQVRIQLNELESNLVEEFVGSDPWRISNTYQLNVSPSILLDVIKIVAEGRKPIFASISYYTNASNQVFVAGLSWVTGEDGLSYNYTLNLIFPNEALAPSRIKEKPRKKS